LNEKFTEYEHMQKFVPKNYIYLHTSGHADIETIKNVCNIINPKMLIPIHSENPSEFKNMRTKKLHNKISKRWKRN